MKKTAIPSLLLSAVLLFYVQPFFGRLVLPFFGSSASVWTTCLAFFQIVLLLGYLYTHFLRRLKPKAQSVLHFGVLTLCTLLTLRLFDVSTFREAAARASYSPSPVLSLLGLLFVWIGPAYFTLSTNSPLMQAWVGSVDTKQRKVYRLYALSNIGSFVGLFAYPIIVEPHLPISLQAPGFVVAFVVFAALTLASALQFFVRRPETKPIEALAKPSGRHGVIPPADDTGSSPQVSKQAEGEAVVTEGIPIQQTRPGTYLIVLAVSFSTTLLLMGITQHLSVDIPPFPLMWTVLLGLFLIGYILGFSGYTVAKHRYWVVLAGVLLVIEAFLSTRDWASAVNLDVMRMVVSCIVLLVVCVTFNTWQYHLRPAESGLTIFYLMLSVGGALAGFFASVAAPLLFNRALEYPISLVVAACMVGVYCFVEKRVTLTVYRLGYLLPVVVLVCLCAKPELANTKTIWRGRSFYSVLSIVDEISPNPHGRPHHIRHLFHGNTTHGQQLMSDRKRPPVPTVYYSEFSGIGLFLKHIDVQTQASISVGLIGLGVGSLASYGRPGDTYTFYEIDPLVQEIAKNEQYFTFLSESPAEIRHVTGDARICLEDELKRKDPHGYDVFVADAFSSDTIPMHLLTVEAFRLYRAHLNEGGVIVVHISNRYFDFVPLMKALADELGLVLTVYTSTKSGLCFAADWAFFTEAPLTFAENPYGGVVDTAAIPAGTLWTDDFHSLWPLLKPF